MTLPTSCSFSQSSGAVVSHDRSWRRWNLGLATWDMHGCGLRPALDSLRRSASTNQPGTINSRVSANMLVIHSAYVSRNDWQKISPDRLEFTCPGYRQYVR